MKITDVRSRFAGQWEVELQIEPGSVPDRPMPHSSVGASYRPGRLRLVFYTDARLGAGAAALRMENGSGYMKMAAEAVRVSSVVIFGPRLKKDGTAGQHVADEKFYNASPRNNSVPEWVREIILTQLQALGGKS